jgi:hypothetical protein
VIGEIITDMVEVFSLGLMVQHMMANGKIIFAKEEVF